MLQVYRRYAVLSNKQQRGLKKRSLSVNFLSKHAKPKMSKPSTQRESADGFQIYLFYIFKHTLQFSHRTVSFCLEALAVSKVGVEFLQKSKTKQNKTCLLQLCGELSKGKIIQMTSKIPFQETKNTLGDTELKTENVTYALILKRIGL